MIQAPLFESLGIAKLLEGQEQRLALYLWDASIRNARKLSRSRLYDLSICSTKKYFCFLLCEVGKPNHIVLFKLYKWDARLEGELKELLDKYKVANIFHEANISTKDKIYDAIYRLGYSDLVPIRKNISANIKIATQYVIELITDSDGYPKEDDARIGECKDMDDIAITALALLIVGSLTESEANASAQYMREIADQFNNDIDGIKAEITKQIKEKAQDGGTRLTVDCRIADNVPIITEYLVSLGYKTEKPSPSAYLTAIW